MPHLAVPWLTGFMRQNGHTVFQRDLNAEFFDEILTRRHLQRAIKRIRKRFPPPGSRRAAGSALAELTRAARPNPEQVRWALEKGAVLAEKVEKAKAVMRSQQFYEGETSLPAFLTLAEALEIISLAHYPARLEMSSFSDALSPDSSRDLLVSTDDPDINPFHEIFQQGILPDIIRRKPDLVGISIPTQGQLLAGLTLAGLLRKAGLKCHITAGGPHITMLREQIPQVPVLFDYFDSFVFFDGEIPLLRLVEALGGDGDLSDVPNLAYRQPETGEIRCNPLVEGGEVRQVQQSISPDFDGLQLERYLTPEPILPLIAAHGCYHGKCGFCNVGYGDPFHYYPYPVDHIAAQMNILREKYGCRHVFFVDEAIPPRTLRRLGEALKNQPEPVNWCGAVRLEKALIEPLLQQISASGCRMLLYGLETASEPIIQRMVKGTHKEEMSRVLHDAAAAGIWNHTFFFFGFPGETLADAQETVNFIYAHQDVIHSASPGAFTLERYAPAHLYPEQFGILSYEIDPRRDLAIYFDYTAAEGMQENEANLLVERLIDQLPDKRYGQYYINDIYKMFFASQLHRQGKPLPRWIEEMHKESR